MNTFQVEVATPFGRGMRPVEIPAEINLDSKLVPEVLELIFKYGQNDFQPRPGFASVSVGDIIHYGNAMFRVDADGFSIYEPGANDERFFPGEEIIDP